MKTHHKLVHAYDTTRQYNRIITAMDVCTALLQGEDINGYPIEGLTIEEAKSAITANTENIKVKFADVQTFLTVHEIYVLEEYTNKSRTNILADKLTADTFSDNLKDSVSSASIGSLDKLSKISAKNDLMYATPVQFETAYHYCVMLNDWLDASSYALRGIRERDGLPHNWKPEQVKSYVRGCLNQFGDLIGHPFPLVLQSEVSEMVEIQEYVLAHLDDTDFKALADYIDHYPKLPVIRRLWSV